MKKKGFTLIELMIVVAIIGVLAAVAIPKFANLIRKANEAAAKGQLGAVRSALSIYYGDQEGTWPYSLGEMTPTYLQEIPAIKTGSSPNGKTSLAVVTNVAVGTTECTGNGAGNSRWWYNSGQASGGLYQGQVQINLSETDVNQSAIHSW